MRVLGNIPAASAVKNHTRNIEIDVQKSDFVEYADKVTKDPRIKKYGRPSFSESEVKERMESHKLEQLAEKAKSEKRRLGRMNKQQILA
ncbi:MAG: hypothetical protein KAG61_05575, partial [Bacteriovoracaceae bacterium]|nr:hypothetical protein [Bacteriovoracaceae bacterium]